MTSVFLANRNSSAVGNENDCFYFLEGGVLWVDGRFSTRWVGLHVIAEKMKIYSYRHVIKNVYPPDYS